MTTNNEPTRRTLEEVPGRALKFLRGAGTSPAIRAILARHGYTDEEHALGWLMVHKVSGFTPGPSRVGADDPMVRAAIRALDAWDDPHFARIRAILERDFPAQAAFLFDGLEPVPGVAAVLMVATLLGRLDQLELGEGREATHEEDLAAIERLHARGYGAAERNRLAGLVQIAQRGADIAEDEHRARARVEHEANLGQLRGWYHEWSTTAHVVIRRRDQLIRLGLARRKKRDAAGEPAPPPLDAVTPVAPPMINTATNATPAPPPTPAGVA